MSMFKSPGNNSALRIFKNLKIQYKLILVFLVLMTIPFTILGFLSYYKSYSVIMSETVDNSGQLVKQVTDKIDYNMKEIDRNTLLFVWDDQTQRILNSHYSTETLSKRKANQMELEAAMQTFLNTRLEIESVYIYREDGEEFYIDNSSYSKEIRKKILMKRHVIISEAEAADGRNNWTDMNADKGLITGARAIYDTINLDRLGVLIINFQENYLRSLYDGVKLTPNSFFIIRDRNGMIISTNSGLGSDSLYNILNDVGNGEFFITGQVSDFTGWEVLQVIPAGELLGGINQVGSSILLAGILCITVSTILLVLLSSYIVKPIKRLAHLMKKVEQEDFTVKAEPDSKDELGELTSVFNRMIVKIRYLIEEVYKQKIVKQEAEFKLLQAQINPHFLYNTLDSINWIAKINGVEDISRMVVALGQLMRISVSKGSKFMTLDKELEYINNYLIIQSMRYRDKFKIHMEIDEESKSCIIPKLILQPIVENALVHGIEKKIGKGNIIIKTKIESDKLIINIIDDGIGMDSSIASSILNPGELELNDTGDEIHAGIGLSNVNKRIKVIYGNDYGVYIDSHAGRGTDVGICLPLKYVE